MSALDDYLGRVQAVVWESAGWISRDATERVQHLTQGWNLYAYANGNPTEWTDPSGNTATGTAAREATKLGLRHLGGVARAGFIASLLTALEHGLLDIVFGFALEGLLGLAVALILVFIVAALIFECFADGICGEILRDLLRNGAELLGQLGRLPTLTKIDIDFGLRPGPGLGGDPQRRPDPVPLPSPEPGEPNPPDEPHPVSCDEAWPRSRRAEEAAALEGFAHELRNRQAEYRPQNTAVLSTCNPLSPFDDPSRYMGGQAELDRGQRAWGSSNGWGFDPALGGQGYHAEIQALYSATQGGRSFVPVAIGITREPCSDGEYDRNNGRAGCSTVLDRLGAAPVNSARTRWIW